jgi:hypothetical protein
MPKCQSSQTYFISLCGFPLKRVPSHYAETLGFASSPQPTRAGVFDLETGDRVGTGPKGGTQTSVRVHVDDQGRIHGHPSGKEIF